MLLRWLLVLFLSIQSLEATRPRPNILKKRNPTYSTLSNSSLSDLVSLTSFDSILNYKLSNSFLSKLLVPRLVGSKALIQLQLEITAHFKQLNWHIQLDEFKSNTPNGIKTFKNLIFTHDITATRYFTLAAHLDSKDFGKDPFIGATDSAAPCAMLIDIATALTPWLEKRKERVQAQGGEEGEEGQGESLQIIFFDGEEAFHDWSQTDSIYGARSVTFLSPIR